MGYITYCAAGTRADQPVYTQFPHAGCAVGCGAVAWAMLFGWADRQGHLGHPRWSRHTGLYRADGGTGADAVAPIAPDEGVRNMIREIRGWIGTFCAGTSGATPPWTMPNVLYYLASRASVRLVTAWNYPGAGDAPMVAMAIDSICNRGTPVVIGTGWLSHYPLAWGFGAYERVVRNCVFWHCWSEVQYSPMFQVNNGWGSFYTADWVPATTWFVGVMHGD